MKFADLWLYAFLDERDKAKAFLIERYRAKVSPRLEAELERIRGQGREFRDRELGAALKRPSFTSRLTKYDDPWVGGYLEVPPRAKP